ncbi:MAG TPA: hypothetical protein V6D17_12630 [Candidatus Obscuribacterales bacterium]
MTLSNTRQLQQAELSGSFFAALVVFVLINFLYNSATGTAIASTASKSCSNAKLADAVRSSNVFAAMYATWPWWVAHEYVKENRVPDVVLFGSSQMNSVAWTTDANKLRRDLDCVLHRRVATLEEALNNRLGVRDVSVFNCALSGAMISDHYAIANALFSRELAPKICIVGVSPRDFIDNMLPSVNSTDAFRFFSRYCHGEALFELAFENPFERLLSRLEGSVDGLAMRGLHRYFESYVHSLPQHATTVAPLTVMAPIMGEEKERMQPGLFKIPADFPDIYHDNTPEYMRRYRNPNPPILAKQIRFFHAFLQSMQAKDIRVLVVGMPLRPQNRDLLPSLFWTNYRAMLASACNQYGAKYVDLSDSSDFTQKDFVDTVHVKTSGGYKLVRKFTDAVESTAALAQSLRTPDERRLATAKSLQQ